jgi:hypothetical protein
MTRGQKIAAKKFYNRLVHNNYKTGYFSDVTVNIMGNYCFEFEMDEEFSGWELTLKRMIEANNFEVLQNQINTRRFLAIYNG